MFKQQRIIHGSKKYIMIERREVTLFEDHENFLPFCCEMLKTRLDSKLLIIININVFKSGRPHLAIMKIIGSVQQLPNEPRCL